MRKVYAIDAAVAFAGILGNFVISIPPSPLVVALPPLPRYPFKPTLASIPALDQYLLLSMLVHVLVILLFGDAGNGIRGGQRIWGAMNVTLQDLLPGQGGLTAPPLKTDTRLASVDRIRESRRPAGTAPAAQGRAAAESAVTPASEAVAVPPEPTPADTPPAQPAPRVIAKEVDKPVTGFVVPPPSPAGEAAKAGKVADLPLPELPAAKTRTEQVTGVPLAPIPALKTEQVLAIPAQLKIREQAAVPPLAPVSSIAPSPGEREYVRANALPKLPAIAAPAAATLAPDKIDRQLAAPQQPIPKLAPIEAPSTALAAPAAMDRELTTPLAPLPRMAPVAIPAVETIAPARIDRELVAPNPSLPPLPQIAQPAATSVAPARIEREFVAPATGAGDVSARDARSADSRTDRNAGLAASGAASAGEIRDAKSSPGAIGPGNAPENVKSAPALGLESLRQRARELAAEGTGPRTALPFPTAPKPPAKTSAQQAFDKALKRPDCKDAYAGMGLAAVVPLLVDTVTDNGCKW